jgi:hypothetical protein
VKNEVIYELNELPPEKIIQMIFTAGLLKFKTD